MRILHSVPVPTMVAVLYTAIPARSNDMLVHKKEKKTWVAALDCSWLVWNFVAAAYVVL